MNHEGQPRHRFHGFHSKSDCFRLRAHDGQETGYSLDDIARIQFDSKVGNTPLFELKNLTEAVRAFAGPGDATILVKDEAENASGSFKARRASISAFEARKKGYTGMAAASSGNYGAAVVASQAAMRGLKCIILEEVFDSRYVGQPEIVEKSRACGSLWRRSATPLGRA